MRYFSTLFDKELYMFRTDLLSIIRSLNTVYMPISTCHTSWLSASEVILTSLADSQLVWQISITVNTILRLLMMDNKSVRNM